MVMRAVNYVLDDKEAFQVSLTNGDVEIHNIAIERCFRHIAMGCHTLTKRMQGLLDSIPFFKDVDYICVVPSSHAFVREIVSGLKEFDFSDISSSLSWNKKTELKNADSLEDKLDALLDSHLVIADDVDLEGKSILLVDDLYQSGLTMQYVAMMLKNAGCSRVFGLTLVKSLGNN